MKTLPLMTLIRRMHDDSSQGETTAQNNGIPAGQFFKHNSTSTIFLMAQPGDLADTVKQQADIVRVVGDYV
ncbi:MAG TPA: hypothetical protein VI685_03895, partial [Candidatus Angelobacter sp.]